MTAEHESLGQLVLTNDEHQRCIASFTVYLSTETQIRSLTDSPVQRVAQSRALIAAVIVVPPFLNRPLTDRLRSLLDRAVVAFRLASLGAFVNRRRRPHRAAAATIKRQQPQRRLSDRPVERHNGDNERCADRPRNRERATRHCACVHRESAQLSALFLCCRVQIVTMSRFFRGGRHALQSALQQGTRANRRPNAAVTRSVFSSSSAKFSITFTSAAQMQSALQVAAGHTAGSTGSGSALGSVRSITSSSNGASGAGPKSGGCGAASCCGGSGSLVLGEDDEEPFIGSQLQRHTTSTPSQDMTSGSEACTATMTTLRIASLRLRTPRHNPRAHTVRALLSLFCSSPLPIFFFFSPLFVVRQQHGGERSNPVGEFQQNEHQRHSVRQQQQQ